MLVRRLRNQKSKTQLNGKQQAPKVKNVSKRIKQYSGYHTHPSQDSSTKQLEDGTLLVTHRIDRREGFIITQLAKTPMSTADLRDKLNAVFPQGGYNVNHVFHACKRLQEDGILQLEGHTWNLSRNGRAKWEKITKRVSKFKAAK